MAYTFSRRSFLKATGAAVALAGMTTLTGCSGSTKTILFGETVDIRGCKIRFSDAYGDSSTKAVDEFHITITNKSGSAVTLKKSDFAIEINGNEKPEVKYLSRLGYAEEKDALTVEDGKEERIAVMLEAFEPKEAFKELQVTLKMGGKKITAITREAAFAVG